MCVRTGFQGRSKLTWKVSSVAMIYELYGQYRGFARQNLDENVLH